MTLIPMVVKKIVVKNYCFWEKKKQLMKFIKPVLPDNCYTYNMNNNPKNNILMSKNIRQ